MGVLFLSVSSVYAETADEYYNRGLAYDKQGNLTQVISDYTKAIGINPKHAKAYCGRGNAYVKQDNLPQAISDYTKAIEINPKYAVAYNNRALVYFVQKDFAKAWEDVHKAQDLGYRVNPEFLEKLKKASGRDK